MPLNESNVLDETYSSLSEDDVSIHPSTHPPPILFYSPHLYWNCIANSPDHLTSVPCKALLDHGSHAVLISEEFATQLGACH